MYHVPDLQNMGEYTTEDGGQSARILLQSWAESGPTVSEVQVLLHELVHVAEFGFQIEDLTETQVDVISAVITAGLVSADLVFNPNHSARTIQMIARAALMYKVQRGLQLTDQDNNLLTKLSKPDLSLSGSVSAKMRDCQTYSVMARGGTMPLNQALSQIGKSLCALLS